MKNSLFSLTAGKAVIFIALLSALLHLFCAGNLEYHRDELLYFAQGMHPAAGYNSVPPLTGLIAWLVQNTVGYSVLAVRLVPAILGGVLIILTAALVKELGGSGYAVFLSSVGLMISIFFQRTFFLFQPVHIEVFLWTLIIYIVVRYINSGNEKLLIYLGAACGLALLNKYLAGMLIAGLFLIVPFTRHRIIFSKRNFYIGLLTGFLIFLPNIIWQIYRDFPVFHHFAELYDSQLVHMDMPLFLREQLLMSFIGSVFTVTGIIYFLGSVAMKKYRLLAYLSLFVVLGLMLLKGKSYYTLGIFPLLIAAGSTAFGMWIERKWIKIAFPLILILLSLPVIPLGIPVFKAAGMIEYFERQEKEYGIDTGRRFEDGSIHSLPQDYADMLGWEELTLVAARAYDMVKDKKAAFIYGDNYGEASALTVIGRKYGLPEAVCFSESFQYWYPESFDTEISSIVYVNDEKPGEDVLRVFSKVTKVGSITNPHSREYGTSVWLLEEPVSSFSTFWTERTSSLK